MAHLPPQGRAAADAPDAATGRLRFHHVRPPCPIRTGYSPVITWEQGVEEMRTGAPLNMNSRRRIHGRVRLLSGMEAESRFGVASPVTVPGTRLDD